MNLSPDSLKQAQWHGGLPSSLRLHAWFQQANVNDYNGDNLSRKNALMICYREIRSKCGKAEREKLQKAINKINKEIQDIHGLKGNKFISSQLPSHLDDFENLIRDYADKHGLTNPDKQTIYDIDE